MGFTTLATAAVTAAKVLPDALQAHSLHKQSKALNNIAASQELMANQQAGRMEDSAVANQQRAARNAAAQMSAARADAVTSNLMPEGSAHVRELDLATRLQDEINLNTNAALEAAGRTRQQGRLQAWNTRSAAAQAKMGAIGSGLSVAGGLFSGISSQLNDDA